MTGHVSGLRFVLVARGGDGESLVARWDIEEKMIAVGIGGRALTGDGASSARNRSAGYRIMHHAGDIKSLLDGSSAAAGGSPKRINLPGSYTKII